MSYRFLSRRPMPVTFFANMLARHGWRKADDGSYHDGDGGTILAQPRQDGRIEARVSNGMLPESTLFFFEENTWPEDGPARFIPSADLKAQNERRRKDLLMREELFGTHGFWILKEVADLIDHASPEKSLARIDDVVKRELGA